jgi:hypothetical protein
LEHYPARIPGNDRHVSGSGAEPPPCLRR